MGLFSLHCVVNDYILVHLWKQFTTRLRFPRCPSSLLMTIFWYIFESNSQLNGAYIYGDWVVNDYILVHLWKQFTTKLHYMLPTYRLLMTIFWYIFESNSQLSFSRLMLPRVVNDYILVHLWKQFTTQTENWQGLPRLLMTIFWYIFESNSQHRDYSMHGGGSC